MGTRTPQTKRVKFYTTYILQHSFSQHHTHLTLLRFSSACPSYLIKSKKDRALWGSFRYWFAYLFFLCFIQFFFHQSVYNGPTDSLAKACWCTRLSPLGSSSNQAPFDEKYLLTKKRVLQHIHTFKVKLQIRNKKRKWSEELPVVSRPTSTLYVSIKFRTFDHSAFFFPGN